MRRKEEEEEGNWEEKDMFERAFYIFYGFDGDGG